MLPYDSLDSLGARHERRARAEAKGHSLPERVEERRADAVLLLNELHHGEVVAFGSPHALGQALAAAEGRGCRVGGRNMGRCGQRAMRRETSDSQGEGIWHGS
jgi:hypothetical protein